MEKFQIWCSKNVSMFVILSGLVGAAYFMHTEIMGLQKNMNERFAVVEKDITIIKTVLITKGIMSDCLARDE